MQQDAPKHMSQHLNARDQTFNPKSELRCPESRANPKKPRKLRSVEQTAGTGGGSSAKILAGRVRVFQGSLGFLVIFFQGALNNFRVFVLSCVEP